jgi:preprotein translocase subunit SecG
MLRVILTVVQVFAAFAIIALVLLQRGKGAEAGAGFGAGASGTVFGARGASTALSRMTAIFAAVFMLNSLLLTYLGTSAAQPPRTILDEAAHKSAPLPAPTGTQPQAPPLTLPGPSAPADTSGAPASSPAPQTVPSPAPSDSSAAPTQAPPVVAPPPVVPPAPTQPPASAPK